MDFTVFDHSEHMTALTWLGTKDWMIYRDLPEQRAISAKPKKLSIKPKQQAVDNSSIVVNEKEFHRYPSEMWRILKEMINVLEYDVIGTLWYNTLAKALAGGPKIFRPTHMQCEALENAEARYAFKDYKQPFPVIILEIPEEYRQELKKKYNIYESPQYVLVNHDDSNEFITVSAFYNKSNIITHITPNRAEYATIEESLIRNRNRRKDNVDFQIAEGEFDAAENVQRLGINFGMMMSLYTVKVAGFLDPTNYKIWQNESRAVRKGGVPTNKALEAKKKLAAAMQLIQFDQKVDFYDEIEEQIEVAQNTEIEKLHKSPASHWRRGHFAMQPCGVGRRDRKMIFRKPILIRAKYFLGNIKNASATYTIHPGRNNLQPPPKQEVLNNTPTPQLPLPEESDLKIGQIVEIVDAEDSLVGAGTQGMISKITNLGSNIIQIDAITEEGRKFSLLSPPDEFKVL